MTVYKRIQTYWNTYSRICGQKLKLGRKPLLSRFNSIGILHRQFIHLVSFLVLVSAQSLGLFVCILNSQEDCKSHCVPRKARKEIKATIPVLTSVPLKKIVNIFSYRACIIHFLVIFFSYCKFLMPRPLKWSILCLCTSYFKIWELILFWGVKTHFGKMMPFQVGRK